MLATYSHLFGRIAPILAILAAFLLPFKLSLSYIFLVPLIAGWIIFESYTCFKNFDQLPTAIKYLVAFLICTTLTSLFGLSPYHTLQNLFGLFLYPLIIPIFWWLGKENLNRISKSLIVGLSVACFLNVLRDSTLGFSTKFIGSVSQSGQLSIALFLVGLLWVLNTNELQKTSSECTDCSYRAPILFISVAGLTASVLLIGWSKFWPSINYLALFGLCLFILSITTIWLVIRKRFHNLFPFLICLPILASTLLVNLKRGPWLGVISGFALLALLTKRKLFLAPIALAIFSAICITPIRDRVIEAKDHFFITGGRSEIWQIGFELLQKYPLGIGFENSGVLREFSNTIPHNLKHFHSNLLNIAVETGWLGLLLFVGFFYYLLNDFLLARQKLPGAAWIAAGITSCFCAGFVEYNFGDSAVCNYLYIFIGLGFSLIAIYPSYQSQS